ncbi:unnamed protein product [Vitrella brassicaformis CCMP3155]|uniref:Calcium uniporter protein n=2 Tax=Vitrella brassicaformis TaxID=1169539 RepID=A0A0G4F191_VITBC|nr:unnamed protein product [Vitrella brassicaformis CCMP3155]|mmetsp:Transcript_54008/g.135769  ORF Transcript_54008/g.135769 Transcript_54008/m.135769 type:complete len:249 (+) Transcript_54008:35-781(+)|eukprot:CEM05143.1 unnamed protein product [Vitrella brassicaformis CCMP3155]
MWPSLSSGTLLLLLLLAAPLQQLLCFSPSGVRLSSIGRRASLLSPQWTRLSDTVAEKPSASLAPPAQQPTQRQADADTKTVTPASAQGDGKGGQDEEEMSEEDRRQLIEELKAAVVKLGEEDVEKNDFPIPLTRGNVILGTLFLSIAPFFLYSYILETTGMDEFDLQRWFGVGAVGVATLIWTLTYVFRVYSKDTTYARQLRDYERKVLIARLDDLTVDEAEMLVLSAQEEQEREDQYYANKNKKRPL